MQRELLRLAAWSLRNALRRTTVEWVVVLGWLTALAVIETGGRGSNSDLTDAAMLLALCLLMIGTAVVHWAWKLRSVSAIVAGVERLRRRLLAGSIEHGVDLRGKPPIARAVPARWLWLLAWMSLAAAALGMWFPHFPGTARMALASRFYLPAVAGMGLLWLGLGLTGFVLLLLVVGSVHDAFVESFHGQGPRSLLNELLVVGAAASAMILGAVLLPAWAPLAIYGSLFTVVSAALLASSPGLNFLWRRRDGGPVRRLDGRWLLWWHWAVLTLLATVLVLASRGQALSGRPGEGGAVMPLTLMFGNVVAWLGVGGLGVAAFDSVRFAALGIRFNPQRRLPSPVPTADSDQAARLARKGEIENRRRIVRGLQKLFKRAARQAHRRGTGYWIALQHWFVLGLSRDDEGAAMDDRETTALDGIIGQPYHRVFSCAARYHYWQITQALEIDLVFVEDGVSFRRLVRVLRVMFETYDVYGGRQRAEERHFVGLPGTRVVIHEFDLSGSESHGRPDYPEPDYRQIGRARILHVFKDRGEQEELEPVPSSWEGAPVFSGV